MNKAKRKLKKHKKMLSIERKNLRKNAEVVSEIEATNEVDQKELEDYRKHMDWLRKEADFIQSLD